MDEFVKVGTVDDFPQGRGRAVDVDGSVVAVFHVDDRFVAMQDACPHMGASLADGLLAGNSVVCHWHGWQFDLDTGRTAMRSWACARVFEVRVQDNDVWVKRAGEEPADERKEPEERDELIPWDPDRFFKS